MKRRGSAIIGIMLFIVLCFSWGCQETPTQSYVIPKGDGVLEERITEVVDTPQSISIQDKVSDVIYERDGLYSIEIDAKIETPSVDRYPVFSIQPSSFSQTRIDGIVNYFFPNQVFYEASFIRTKDDIEKQLERITKDMESMQEESDDWITAQNAIEQLKSSYTDAPDASDRKQVDPVLSIQAETKYEVLSAYTDMGYPQLSWIDITNTTDGSLWNMMTLYLDRDNVFLGSLDAEKNMDTSKLTPDEATALAKSTLAALDISGFIPTSVEKAYSEITKEYGYAIRFRRAVNGIPVVKSTILDYSGERVPVSAKWAGDSICIRIGQNGITAFEWDNNGEITGEISSNVELLPFEEIYEIAKQQLKNKYAWLEKTDTGCTQKIYVEKIALEYRCVASKNESSSFLLIPTWNFYGDILCKYSDGSEILTYEGRTDICHIVINAIDGTNML